MAACLVSRPAPLCGAHKQHPLTNIDPGNGRMLGKQSIGRDEATLPFLGLGAVKPAGVRIHETLSTMVARWERQGLNPPAQLTSVLGGERLESRTEASMS